MRTPFVLLDTSIAAADVDQVVPLGADRDHHLRRVLRREDGDEVEVTDGNGSLAPATLVAGGVRLTAAPTAVPPPAPAVTVLHALPKGRALDEVTRTLAELGVARLRPVVTNRTESRPSPDKARSVGDRLRSVAQSALEQARSAHVMEVDDPTLLPLTLRDVPSDDVLLAAHPGASMTLGARLATVGPEQPIHLLIGPEGGLDDAEVVDLGAGGWTVVRAGDTVLRTVHAATVLTAAVLALSGRFGAVTGEM